MRFHGSPGRTTPSSCRPGACTSLPARSRRIGGVTSERWKLIGDVPLTRLTPDLLRKLTAELSGRYAPETVARTMRWVRLTLNQAVRDRRIARSPADGVRLPRSRGTEMRLLDATEVAALAAALPERYGSLPIVAAYSGLRWGELARSAGPRPRPAAPTDDGPLRACRSLGPSPEAGSAQVEGVRENDHASRASSSRRWSDTSRRHPPVDEMVWTTERGALLRRGSFGRIWRQSRRRVRRSAVSHPRFAPHSRRLADRRWRASESDSDAAWTWFDRRDHGPIWALDGRTRRPNRPPPRGQSPICRAPSAPRADKGPSRTSAS